MASPADGPVEPHGDLELRSPAFDDGGQLPDSTGYANENRNPPLTIEGCAGRRLARHHLLTEVLGRQPCPGAAPAARPPAAQ